MESIDEYIRTKRKRIIEYIDEIEKTIRGRVKRREMEGRKYIVCNEAYFTYLENFKIKDYSRKINKIYKTIKKYGKCTNKKKVTSKE